MIVPQANPGAGYLAHKALIDRAIRRVLSSGSYVLGREGAAFENEFSAWLGADHAVACGSGTDSLFLALRALEVGPGSAVVTVSHTATATIAAILATGASPLLIDIDPYSFTMDPDELAMVLSYPPRESPQIKAVIPVHLYGQAADLAPILKNCAASGVQVIEDCAQAHGATYGGKRVGTFSEAAGFSFYPTKNLGAFGDGGLLATSDRTLAERAQALRQYGWKNVREGAEPGFNSRLDELQAAILRVKLSHLDASNQRRQVIAKSYDETLLAEGAAPPARRPGCEHVFHQYVLKVAERDVLQARLRDLGIGTSVHYAVPVHKQTGYVQHVLIGPSGCKTSVAAAQEVISLPMYPELTDDQVSQVCDALRHVLRGGAHVTSERSGGG